MKTPLTDFDLRQWCQQLEIPLKGVFLRYEARPRNHSPCIINLNNFRGAGIYWVCSRGGEGGYEYFDSFGLPPPLEWKNELALVGKVRFSGTRTSFSKKRACAAATTAYFFERAAKGAHISGSVEHVLKRRDGERGRCQTIFFCVA